MINDKANDTIDELTRFLELVNAHLKEKNCNHIIRSLKRICKFKWVNFSTTNNLIFLFNNK
jgi:hypothetical protein